MKQVKRALSLVLVLAMLLSLAPGALAAATYKDVPESHWAYAYVEDVTDKGLMNGVDTGLFSPESTMTRAMFVTVLARMSGETLDDTAPTDFSDVPAGKWYTGAVNWASETGVVNGYANGKFGPEDPVTREQAATMLVRYADMMALALETSGGYPLYLDEDDIADYAHEAVTRCGAAGILNGYPDGTFLPRKAITRAEAAKVLSVFVAVAELPEPEPTEPDPTEPDPTDPTEPPTEPDPTDPIDPTEPEEFYVITFAGENGYVKYGGEKVEQITVSSRESYVEFGVYGVYDDGYELDTVNVSSGKLDRAGNICILSGIEEDITVTYTTRFRTVQIDYVISPNYQNNYLVTPQYVTWGTVPALPTVNRVGYHVKAWYYDAEYTQEFDFTQPLKEDVTLYGEWSRNVYTLTFMVDGQVYNTQQVEHNSRAVAVPNPTKDNFVFNGWYYDEACTEPYNRASDYIVADTTVYAAWVEAKLNYVYLNGSAGNDANTGATPSDAVRSVARAYELLADAAYKEIRITGMITVSDTQVWDLSAYPEAIVRRDESYPGSYLFWVNATGNLTLQNIVIDGGAEYWAAEDGTPFESYMVFNCTSGTVTMNAGTELRNTKAGIYSSSGVAYLNGATLIINDGVKIHHNAGAYASVIGGTSSGNNIVMNGGEIYDNVAFRENTSATSTSAGNGVIVLYGSSSGGYATFTMNGGKIYNNYTGAETSTFGAGVIFMYNRAKFVMNGGEIYGNTGVSAAAIRSIGTSAMPNMIELNGGRFYDNTATLSDDDVEARYYTDIVLNDQNVIPGSYWMQDNANTYPITVPAALTRELELNLEAVVYERVLVKGTDSYKLTEADLAMVKVINEIPEAYKLALDEENNHIYIGSTQNIGTIIYLAGDGNDMNDGLTRETAVATFAKAKQLLTMHQSATGDNVIYVVGGTTSSNPAVINITGNETWSLKGIPNAYMQMEPTAKSYMFYVTGTLTLEDIIIDGNRFYSTSTNNVAFRVELETNADKDPEELTRGVLNLKSGTVLRNFPDEAVYCYGGTVNMYEGAEIYGCTKDAAIYATGILQATGKDYRPIINIYGGKIHDNYRAFYILGEGTLNIYDGEFYSNGHASTPGGAVIYGGAAGVTVNIHGGTFRDNFLTGTGTYAMGTVFYASTACTLNVYGGTYRNNTCAKVPHANGFTLFATTANNNPKLYLKDTVDLTGVPVFYKLVNETATFVAEKALAGKIEVYYETVPAAGQVVMTGTDSYKLTTSDLNKVSCGNEGVTFRLDTANNQIVVDTVPAG